MKAKVNIKDILGKDGAIAKSLKHYEERPEQIEMAKAVQDAILSSTHLIVEAGTGIGKSIAYLVPFIYWATKEKKRVVISTYTKTLQQQLVEKDLPFLKKALEIDLQFSLCLGSENYLCLRRARGFQSYDLFASKKDEEELTNLHKWQKETETGLKQDLPFEPSQQLWANVCRMQDLCLGNDCPYRNNCFYNQARKAQYKSHLLVCNHHLYFANLASGNKALPAFDAVVFDEAHSIEDVATNYLGKEVSNLRIKYLCDSLLNPKTGKGILTKAGAKRIAAEDILSRVRASSSEFFSNLTSLFGTEAITKRIRKPDFVYNSLIEPISALSSYLGDLGDGLSKEEERIEVSAFSGRITELNDDLEAIIKQTLKDYVYWVEIAKRPNFTKYTLCAAPINVADEFKKQVLDKVSPVVLTSATLSTNGSFDYIKARLQLNPQIAENLSTDYTDKKGNPYTIKLGNCQELLLSSPFNYEKQALLYLASDLPDPTTELALYESCLIKRIEELLSISPIGTFILFTSFKLLNKAYDALIERFPERHLLKQGELPQYKLLEEFKEGGSSILFGTSTFWQGIDVPGKSLQSVIITKLPFAVPDDPIQEARMEVLSSQNINPFTSYQVPQAIIMLKQGFGRLIRTKNDFGLIAILDPRIKTKSYGKRFLNSLPVCKEAKTLKEIEEFFMRLFTKIKV